VEEGSVAAESGIQQGDVLVSINQKKISGTADYARAMKDAERKGSVALLVRRGNASIYFAMKLR
jgi:serine protease Do